jgi:amino acid permease
MKAAHYMNIKKAPVVGVKETATRLLLMFIVIIIGVILSYTAEAGVKIEKSPFNKGIQKKKNHDYSCNVLMKKHRGSSNTIVKTNMRRPKWR